MKTLYESILDNTKNKIDNVKDIIKITPPTSKDWKKDGKYEWYIDYNCKMLIDKYIDILPDALFDGKTSANYYNLKKEDITTIRCVINTHRHNERCRIELCKSDSLVGGGVVAIGLEVYLNGFSTANAKKSVVEYFNRVFNDWDLLGRTFEVVKDGTETLLKWGHSVGGKAIWNIR